MNLTHFRKYIQDIDQGKAINLSKFTSMLTQLSLSHDFRPSDITARKVNGQLYQVTDINDALLSELQQLTTSTGHDRISAAIQNRSHDHKVMGSLLLIRKGIQHPGVITFDDAGSFHYPDELSPSALLIENRQNFISIQRTLKFLQDYTSLITDNLDVIFAEGNEISNSLHSKLLNAYERLYLFFDLDLGGLRIANNLYSLLPNQSISYLQPTDIEKRLSNVVELQSNDYINEVINIGMDCPQLAQYAKLIKDSKRILEQESYLNDT